MSDEVLKFDVTMNVGTSFSIDIDSMMEFVSILETTPDFDIDIMTVTEYEVEL